MSLFGSFQPLSETERFAYLKAMGVTLWVPRDHDELSEQSSLTDASSSDTGSSNSASSDLPSSNTPSLDAVPSQVVASSQAMVEHLHQIQQTEATSDSIGQLASQTNEPLVERKTVSKVQTEAQVTTSPQNFQEQTSDSAPVPSKTVAQGSNKTKTAGFLKLVNWSSGNEHAPLLLIVCRHDPDQPAQSFARPNMPSQFMVDYVRAIQDYLTGASLDFRIQLAHLTEAGLGENNQPIESVLEKQSPQLVLVLGDEGAVHLLGDEQTVSVNRGKLQTILEKVNALVSYHPFTLISQPELKRNALEDLRNLVAFLKLSGNQSE